MADLSQTVFVWSTNEADTYKQTHINTHTLGHTHTHKHTHAHTHTHTYTHTHTHIYTHTHKRKHTHEHIDRIAMGDKLIMQRVVFRPVIITLHYTT